MRKILVSLILVVLGVSVQAQFIYKSSKSTARMDTLQVHGTRIDITNSVKNPMAWIRVSGDSLYLGDGTGEAKLSQMRTGVYFGGYELISINSQITGTALADTIEIIGASPGSHFCITGIWSFFTSITGTPVNEAFSIGSNPFAFSAILLGNETFDFQVEDLTGAINLIVPAVTVDVTAYSLTVIYIGFIN